MSDFLVCEYPFEPFGPQDVELTGGFEVQQYI